MSVFRTPYTSCPLCGEALEFLVDAPCDQHPMWHPPLPSVMHWMTCTGCGHICIDGPFTDEGLRLLFQRTQGGQRVGDDLERARQLWARVVERVSGLLGTTAGSWLDVGFGNGGLLLTALEFGFSVVGLDLREETVAGLRAFGLEAQPCPLESFSSEKPLDVISLADVLEHTTDPKAALRACHRLLRPGGLLFCSLPNADSPLWHLLTAQGGNPYWGEIEHYHNFGRNRLLLLLTEMEFTPVSFGISDRYRVGMEIIARRSDASD